MELTNLTRTVSSAEEITGSSHWLQLFADGPAPAAPVATPGATPAAPPAPSATAVATPGATPATPQAQALVGNIPGQQPPAQPAQPAAPPVAEPVFLDFGGRKVPETPETKALFEDWRNQQAALTKAQQDLLRYKQQILQPPAQPQAQPAPQPTATPAPQATPGDALSTLAQMGITPEQFQSGLYGDNPLQMVAQVADAIVQQRLQTVQPVIQRADQFLSQHEVNQRIDAVAAKYQDFNQVLPQMVPLFDQYPELNTMPNGTEVAYHMAKGMTAQPATPAPTMDDLLKDQTVRARFVQDPQIRQTIIQEHLRSVAAGTPPAPVMASPVAAAVPTMPASQPQTLEQAKKNMLARWASMSQQQ